MLIKMKTMMAGPDGNRGIGDEVTVSDAEGRALVAGGYADDLTPKRLIEVTRIESPEREVIEVEEAATLQPEEAAVIHRGKRNRK